MAAFIALLEDPNLPVVQGGPDARKELKHWLLQENEDLQFYDNSAVLSQKIHNALGWRAKGPTHKVLDALIERLKVRARGNALFACAASSAWHAHLLRRRVPLLAAALSPLRRAPWRLPIEGRRAL